MGYRTYIGTIPKKEYNKIKSLSKKRLFHFYKETKKLYDENSFYIGPYDYGHTLFGFGKYTNFQPPRNSIKPFFKSKELKEEYRSYDFYVVTSEFLIYLIELYTKKIQTYYSDMLNPFFKEKEDTESEFLKSARGNYGKYKFDLSLITEEQQTSLYKIINHIRDFAMEWGIKSFPDMLPYKLEEGNNITTSWKYEYSLFELVRIYKSFDWKKNVLFYYGY